MAIGTDEATRRANKVNADIVQTKASARLA